MSLTSAQLATLKTDINANTNTIVVGGLSMQIKDVPNSPDTNPDIASWYNIQATPNFFVWRTSVTRSEVYHGTSPDNTVWDWAAFKSQSITEQNSWTQMFMGDSAPFNKINFRNGVFNIFSGSAPQNAQRAHIFSVGRRLANRIEKLLSAAVIVNGGISPVANNGNTLTDALGNSTNPALLTLSGFLEGNITGSDVTQARNS